MIPISNKDYRLAVRLLRDLAKRPCASIREVNASRQASLLAKKLTKK